MTPLTILAILRLPLSPGSLERFRSSRSRFPPEYVKHLISGVCTVGEADVVIIPVGEH